MKRNTFRQCQISGVSSRVGYNRPKSLHKTKRLIHPNIQKWHGLLITNRVRRTLERQLNKQTQPKTNANA
jgi:ribosomal protein L28